MILAGAAITAVKWPFRSALFPLIISIPIFFMVLAELLMSSFEKEGAVVKHSAMDFERSEGIDKAVALHRTVITFSWIIGFSIMVLFFGFTIAVPLFVFTYLKFRGREKWGISIVFAAFSGFFFWGLFGWLLRLPLQEGWALRWLMRLGIG